jgi:hypothetical protein
MGFAQEMKDFISAREAGQKMIGAASDEEYKKVKSKYTEEMTKTLQKKNDDEEGDKATLDLKNAQVQNTLASAANHRAQAAYHGRMGQAVDTGGVELPTRSSIVPAETGGTGGVSAPQAPAAPAQAVPVGTGVNPPGFPAPVDQAPLAFKNGGSVQHFADGGAVADQPDEEDPAESAPEPAPEAVPASAPTDEAGTSDTTDISARSRGTPTFSHAAAMDGVHAGATYISKALGLHRPSGVETPGRARAAQAWATGAHAASPDDMAAIQKSIDPDNKLPESSRNLAAVGAVYQFKMNKGEPEAAAKAAGQMIAYYRQASQRYAVIAAAAAQRGDLDTATHAAMKAYANVPDGQNFQVQKTPDGQLSYTITDEKTGKVTAHGLETPQKLASSAMGFAASGFDEALMAAAGQRSAGGKPAVDPNSAPLKTADKKDAIKGIDAAYASQNPAPTDDKTPPKYSADDARDLKGAAYRASVHTANSRMTHEEAMDMTTKIADPSATDAASVPQSKKVDGGYQVRIGKKEIFMPEADYDTLMTKRNAKLEAAKPKPAGEGWGARITKRINDAKAAYTQDATPQQRAAKFTEPQIP